MHKLVHTRVKLKLTKHKFGHDHSRHKMLKQYPHSAWSPYCISAVSAYFFKIYFHTSNFIASMFRCVNSISSNKLVTKIKNLLRRCFEVRVLCHIIVFVTTEHWITKVYAAGVSVARDESASYVSWANSTLVSPW